MKILLPFDGSASALAALSTVQNLARQGLSSDVVLANVQEPASLYELVVAHDPEVIQQVSQAAGEHILQPAQAMLAAAGMAVESVVASGDPAHTLVDILESHGCQIVVMGASGTSTLRGALLGSVSNELLHSCPVPVMIVKASQQDDDAAA
jgi:nucleotide-binding universal stress UspA family protein